MLFLKTLGSLSVFADDGRDMRAVLAQPKRLAVLAIIAISRHRQCPRDSLLGLLWPTQDEEHARAALRQAVRFLRRELGDGLICNIGHHGLALDETTMTSDVSLFERAYECGRFEDALEAYQGEFLAEFNITDASPEFDSRISAERARLQERALSAATALALRHREDGDLSLATRWTRRALALAPEDENLLRSLLELLSEAGDRAGALRTYRDFMQMLQRELAMTPSLATQKLAAAIGAAEG